jgi:hypothetical protein
MIERKSLLMALQRWVKKFENDLRLRCREVPELDDSLRASYGKVKDASRSAESYETWRDRQLTQAAVSWVLACVFVRFLEDNGLIDQPWIAAVGDRRTEAEHVRDRFFSQHPTLSDREYLQHIFTEVGKLPSMANLLERHHNPLWSAGISGDAASEFIAFWRKMEYDFTDSTWNTRFLGDLYQDLSEAARKQFALLQTPAFVAEFILDRTLGPAIETFGYEHVRMIDPACGSGHFILGGFARLLCRWQSGHPELNEREIVMRALEAVAGVDINPFAVAIARFRLLLAAWQACGITRLRAAPDFRVNLAVGDSLLHGRRFREFESDADGPQHTFDTEETFRDELKHHYEVEDPEALHRILGRQYHAVVGNPPYITVKDRALSGLYRTRYPSCRGKYSLSVPFMERFFDLAIKGYDTPQQPAGFIGQITANSFMKREFGKKLIEEFVPRWDLNHVLDTSGAYIPGHGTPTVILFGKNRLPARDTVRTVLGIRGEPATPADPVQGLVWQAICHQIDHPGNESEWVSTADSLRANFHRHPWSIGGGGAAELKEEIEKNCNDSLRRWVAELGISSVTGEDDLYVFPRREDLVRVRVERTKTLVTGDFVRDWYLRNLSEAVWLYDKSLQLIDLTLLPNTARLLWSYRASISRRKRFGTPMLERGLTWYEWQELYTAKLRTPLTITFAFVATHNHFVSDSGNKVFNRSAPIIKLPSNVDFQDVVRLLGLLNSSAACFWLKQVCHNKGSTVDEKGARQRTAPFEDFYEFTATQLADLPIPAHLPQQLPTALVRYSTAVGANAPSATLARWAGSDAEELRKCLKSACDLCAEHRRKLIAWQEELDWQIYEAFGLLDPADGVSMREEKDTDIVYPFGLELGERAFEIVLARRMAAGELQSTWFERHGSTPITKLPHHWPVAYQELVERRIRRIESDPNIRLIEQPEYKRRWNTEPWDTQLTNALHEWLLNRLETAFFEGERMVDKDRGNPAPEAVRGAFLAGREPRLASTRQLADAVSLDADFLQVAALYRDREDFDLPMLVRELLEEESVPFLPAQRYRESGLRKRAQWERTWDLQRLEDEIDGRQAAEAARTATGQPPATPSEPLPEKPEVPVPPKYASADFKKASYWRLRGKLDVPKERWILYPGTERQADPAPVIAWAGWDHKQQAQALAVYYQERKDQDGWTAERLAPLLAGLKDLVPWLKQWHNEIDPAYGLRLGEFYEGFVRDETHTLGLSEAQIEATRTEC